MDHRQASQVHTICIFISKMINALLMLNGVALFQTCFISVLILVKQLISESGIQHTKDIRDFFALGYGPE